MCVLRGSFRASCAVGRKKIRIEKITDERNRQVSPAPLRPCAVELVHSRMGCPREVLSSCPDGSVPACYSAALVLPVLNAFGQEGTAS